MKNIFELVRIGDHKALSDRLNVDKSDINAKDPENGATALHLAAGFGRNECVNVLLDQGADINATDREQWTPLHCAAAKGHQQIVGTLLDHGAELEAQMWDGGNALHMAAKEGHLEIVKCLVEKGAKLDVKVRNGQTAMDLAAMRNQDVVVDYLRLIHAPEGSFDAGANVKAMEELGTLQRNRMSNDNTSKTVANQKYDFFFSYRSVDAELVRGIAEYLMASGISVWFAEYVIRIENYDEFQSYIDEGILASQHLVCFLGDGYFDSVHCLNELEQFIKKVPNAQSRIICVDITDAEKQKSFDFAGLQDASHYSYTGMIEPVVTFLGQQIGKSISVPFCSELPTKIFRFDYRGQDFQITLDKRWKPLPGLPLKAMSVADTAYPPRIAIICGVDVILTMKVGPNDEIFPNQSDLEGDDREAYRSVLQSTQSLIRGEPDQAIQSKLYGVHLVQVGGHSHPSFTREIGKSAYLQINWERKYALSFHSRLHNCVIEYLLSFSIPNCEPKDFFQVAPDLDRIAGSISVGGKHVTKYLAITGILGLLPMLLCWLPSPLIPVIIKLLSAVTLLVAAFKYSNINEINNFKKDLGISVITTMGQMQRILFGTLAIVSLLGFAFTEWSFTNNLLLDPPIKAVWVFFSITLGISFLMFGSKKKISRECPEPPYDRDRYLLKESIGFTLFPQLFHFAFSLGLTVLLLVGGFEIHWGFIGMMIALVVSSFRHLKHSITTNLELIRKRP